MSDKKEVFPTEPNETGFFYETEEEKTMSVETLIHSNGSIVKRVTLKDGKRAVIRQLKGKDMLEVKRMAQNVKDAEMETMLLSKAVKIEGESYPPEHYEELLLPDFSIISAANSLLNFL